MDTLIISKNCGACRILKENHEIPPDVRVLDISEADDETIGKLIDKNVKAIPALITDSGNICVGVEGILACLLKKKK